jgi:uncharacterized protein YceK
MRNFNTAPLLAGIILLLFSTGCSNVRSRLKPQPVRPPAPAGAASEKKPDTFWNSELKGSPSIVIDLSEQAAYFYRGKKVAGKSIISSGRKGHETPAGSYQVIQKSKDHVSNLYGDYVSEDGDMIKKNVDVRKDAKPEGAIFKGAKMPYFLRFQGGYGMHAGHLPGYRASHGCIRMPRKMAERFYSAASIGTPVKVRP